MPLNKYTIFIDSSQFQGEEVRAMNTKCPGQDMKNLRAAMYQCPKCGAEVEMFSDELKIKCRKCGEYVYKEQTPSCIEWCPSARQCLGEARWEAIRGKTG
jgi:NADH pyrophosphatase NudC (nudix superfamily)